MLYAGSTPLSPSQVTYNVQTADNTANNYDIGLYSGSGALLAHVGNTAGYELCALNRLEDIELDSGDHH